MRKSAPELFGRIKAHPPHAEPGQLIGLLGGSFNPPHAAHRMISETALKRLGLDKVWWLVTPGNPLKGRSELAPLAERLMLCRAMASNRRIEVTDFETDLPTSHTYSTLAFLKSRSPLVRFVWLMGADNLAEMERWQRWREIFGLFPIAVVDRPGWRLKALSSKAARAYAGQRVPESQAEDAGADPAAGLDLPDGPAFPGVIDGPAGKDAAARCGGEKGTGARRAALETAKKGQLECRGSAAGRGRWTGCGNRTGSGILKPPATSVYLTDAGPNRGLRQRLGLSVRRAHGAPTNGFDDERTTNTICQPHLRVLARARLRPNSCPGTTRKPFSVTSRLGWTKPRRRKW